MLLIFLFSIVLVHSYQEIAYTSRANNSEYRYVTKILISQHSKSIICTGTVLTNKRVLTGADCMTGQDKKNPNVLVQYGFGVQTRNYNVSKLHFHHDYSTQGPIIWRICLLKLKTALQFGDEKSVGMFALAVSNYLENTVRGVDVTSLGYGRRNKMDTYETMNTLLEMKFTLYNGRCPCYPNEKSASVYCSYKMKLNRRCGDQFGDVGGPVFYQDSIEGILHTIYSDEHCLPARFDRILAPCDSQAYAVVIPICAHKKWLSARVKTTFINFGATCSNGNLIRMTNVLNILVVICLIGQNK